MRWRTALLNPMVLIMAALSIGGMVGVPVLGNSSTSSTPASTADATIVADVQLVSSVPAGTNSPAVEAVEPSVGVAGPTPLPTSTPAATATIAPSVAGATAAPSPVASPTATGTALPAKRIGLQSGHWKEDELPDEFASLRGNKGAMGAGWAERDVNLDITRRVAELLQAKGYQVDVLPATVPAKYKADVFLSIHGDAHNSSAKRGFKVARSAQSAIPAVDDALVATIYRDYAQVTGMPLDDKNITAAMRYYYAFTGRPQHTVAPTTPAAILELGFLTNTVDRDLLQNSPDKIATAVATSLDKFLKR